MKWIPGAVSATFKKMSLSADDVIALAASCGMKALEWSENVHVFPDDPEGAKALKERTEAAGLRVAAYGSYFRLGENADPLSAFKRSLVSAFPRGGGGGKARPVRRGGPDRGSGRGGGDPRGL